MSPRVSICVPAYQAEETLPATVDSVLAQTLSDWEMVIADDHSSDATAEVARSFADPRIRVVTSDRQLGMAANFDRVISLGTAPYRKLLCADDLLHPTCLAAQVEILDADPSLALTAARRDIVDIHGRVVAPGRGIPRRLVGRIDGRTAVQRVVTSGYNPIGEPTCVLFRHEAKEKAGDFWDRLKGPIDLEMWIRMLRYGDFHGDARTLASFRIHPTSTTGQLHAGFSREDRAVFALVSADPYWQISWAAQQRGNLLSFGLDLHRRLRVRRMNRPAA